MDRLFPVLLSGGTGTRLWPASRAALPKQFLSFRDGRTMIQETALRASLPGTAAPLVLCNEDHRFLVAEQMRQGGVPPMAIIVEPVGRNTAPAAAIAALAVAEQDAKGVALLLPCDHFIDRADAFGQAVAIAAEAARRGHIVTFGIQPQTPETGYGYIKRGEALAIDGAFSVSAFVEKPNLETAQAYLADSAYFWNSGMFAFRADILLDEMATLAPEVLENAKAALSAARRDADFVRLDGAAFGRAPTISLDYAVMEHTKRAAIVPCALGWSDVGSWSALWDVSARDGDDNALTGDVISHDSTGCLVRTERGLTALVGVRDLAVIVTDDAVLVADRSRTQDVKAIVETLKAAGRGECEQHATVHRPWGSYCTIDSGAGFQVKHITVKPGGRLSLQLHHRRAEHWTIVEGEGRVTCGEDVFMLRENESTFIPLGTRHRLENPGDRLLRLIEVQCGAYLGEDDIVRLDDIYGRAGSPP